MMKQFIAKTCKTVGKALSALKMPRKTLQTWPGQADKNFQGRTKNFNTIAENFYPRIKIFGGTVFS